MERYDRIIKFANSVINIRREFNTITIWEEYIKTFELCKETLLYFKRSKKTTNEELIALKTLTEELLNLGSSCYDENIRSYKRKMICKLSDEIKDIIQKLPPVEEKNEEIKTVDDWIKSLKIYKLDTSHLSSLYYQNSYDIYRDIRKIVLTKNPPHYKRIYAGRVAEKLDSEKQKLPEQINLQIADYELSEMMRLIKDNKDFNYKLMPFSYEKLIINDRFERQEWSNNLLLLVKNAKNS